MKKLLLAAVVLTAHPAAAETKSSDWHGYEKLDFAFGERTGLLVKPKQAAPGNPWIWRTEFFGHKPEADLALLAAGWHLAYYKVSNMFGSPGSIALMAGFHEHVTREYSLAKRATLEGFSRGGLYAVNFAATHPDKTAALYLDAPVLDIRSWPGGKGKGNGAPGEWKRALESYGLTEETAADFKGNPLDRLAPLAKAGIPIISVCGEADKTVPYLENTAILKQRYEALGGRIEVILKPGVDHHPHSLADSKPIVDFLIRHALK
jgi:pimeloyl-ACP methyl ester carboxylesterase